MTTPQAAQRYLMQHLQDMEGRRYVMFNPYGKNKEDLPRIYVFSNGGNSGLVNCYAMSACGHVLGSHLCSDELYAPHDLGALEGSREDRHKESYQKHYPDGYVMEVIEEKEVRSHVGLNKALQLNQILAEKSKEKLGE